MMLQALPSSGPSRHEPLNVCFIDYYIALEIRSAQKARLSLPMMSRTPCTSFRARMRNLSCLISCVQPGPAGGSLAVDASKNRLDCIRKNGYVILCSTERT
jgi:hypothetical protein